MPQELHVLRCYSCKTFQVQIVKKVPKWQCKVCNEKQSVLKVYAKGSGKECRQYVQDLNMQQGLLAAESTSENTNDYQEDDGCPRYEEYPKGNQQASKWSDYMEDENDKCQSSFKDDDVSDDYSGQPSALNSRVSKWKNYLIDDKEDVSDGDHEQYIPGQSNFTSRNKKRKFNQYQSFSSEDLIQPDENPQKKGKSILLNSALSANPSNQSAVRREFEFGPEESLPTESVSKSSESMSSKWSQFIATDKMSTASLINCRDTDPFLNKGKNVSTSLKQAQIPNQKMDKNFGLTSGKFQMSNKATCPTSKTPFCTLSDDDDLDTLLDL